MNTLANLENNQTYQKPSIEIVEIELEGRILDGSPIDVDNDGNGSQWP